jgi:hypothetical protein
MLRSIDLDGYSGGGDQINLPNLPVEKWISRKISYRMWTASTEFDVPLQG